MVGSVAHLKVWVPDSKVAWKYFSIQVEEHAPTLNPNNNYNASANSLSTSTTLAKPVSPIGNAHVSLSEADFGSLQLISSAFAKNPAASEAFLKTRLIQVSGRPIKFEMQDPDKFVVGLIMTTGLKPEVIFTDDVKKLFGLIDKVLKQDNSHGYNTDAPSKVNNTWLINGSELILHSEWNIADPNWTRNPYSYNYPRGYVPKIIQQKDSPVIGIGEERSSSVRFLKSTPHAVYFDIVK